MIISGSNLQLASSHSHLEYQRTQESLTAWKDGPNGRQQINYQASSERLRMGASSEQLTLSQTARRPQPQVQAPPPAAAAMTGSKDTGKADDADATVDNVGDLKLTMVRLLIEQITGRAVQIFDASDLNTDAAAPPPELAKAAAQQGTSGSSNASDRVGWGVNYSYQETNLEQESTQFEAKGIVRTADGREIELSLELSMDRAYASQTSLSLRAGDALKDPLVINFTGNAAQLTQTTFKFDLDADGKTDNMRFVSPGSGFLALDKNGDGKVNDGRELFGATSGNGFADLAQYDDDGNGWIDEKDAVFNQLRIWSRNGNGNDQLLGLAKMGVGALYLSKTDTPFAVKDAAHDNTLQGMVRATGLYLREDGGAGSLQQLDLVA